MSAGTCVTLARSVCLLLLQHLQTARGLGDPSWSDTLDFDFVSDSVEGFRVNHNFGKRSSSWRFSRTTCNRVNGSVKRGKQMIFV